MWPAGAKRQGRHNDLVFLGEGLKMPHAAHKNDSNDYEKARVLRKTAPKAENELWYHLRQQSEYKFRRQHPIHPYIADFVHLKSRMIIELDGPSHDAAEIYDRKRDQYLENLGYKVLRFTNDDILTNVEGVIRAIMKEIEIRV